MQIGRRNACKPLKCHKIFDKLISFLNYSRFERNSSLFEIVHHDWTTRCDLKSSWFRIEKKNALFAAPVSNEKKKSSSSSSFCSQITTYHPTNLCFETSTMPENIHTVYLAFKASKKKTKIPHTIQTKLNLNEFIFMTVLLR